MTGYELCEHTVVNLCTGQNLGRVDDLTFDPQDASSRGRILKKWARMCCWCAPAAFRPGKRKDGSA